MCTRRCCTGAAQEDQIQATMQLLQRKQLVRRTERLYKKPKPGRKRLTKWPRKLEQVPEVDQVPPYLGTLARSLFLSCLYAQVNGIR